MSALSSARSQRITSIPTLMAFREQMLVFSQAGALSGPALEQRIAMIEGLDMDDLRARSAAHQPVS